MPVPQLKPEMTTVRDPARDIPGKPGFAFESASLADYTKTELHLVDGVAQPIGFGTAHPKDVNLLLVAQKLSDGESGKRNHTRVYASIVTPAEQAAGGYTIDYPYGDVAFPRLSWPVRIKASDYEDLKFSQACLIAGYEALLLTSEALQLGKQGVFAQVTLTYEILPGPWIPFTRYDDNLGPVQGRRRAVLNTGQTASLTATAKTTYEGRDGSSKISLEVQENWSNGTGAGDNPVYPILTGDGYDEQRGPVQSTQQLVVKTGDEVGSLVVADGVLTKIIYEPFNEFLLRKIVETSAIPGPVTTSRKFDNFGGEIITQASLVGAAAAVENTISGLTLTGIVVLYGGSGYVTAPAVTISAPGGGGVTATATAHLTGGVVTSITLNTPGSGYTALPTVTVAAGPGTGAFAGMRITGTAHAQELVGRDAATARLVEYIFAVGVVTRRIRKADASVPNSRAVESRYLVLADSTVPNDTVFTEYERDDFPDNRALEIEIATTFELPPQYVESETAAHPMPTLHYAAYTVTGLGTFYSRRQGFVANVVIGHSHVFSTSRSTAVADVIIPATWSFPNFADQALTPASAGPSTFDPATGTFPAIGRQYTYTDGVNSVLVTLDPSTPSAEDYRDNWIGTLKVIGVDSRIWRAGIYKTTFSTCVMQ